MPKVTLITPSKEKVILEDAIGTLMEAALDADVEGIDGDCGGVCSCSTCHVHVAPEWVERVGPPNDAEADTLEFDERTNSRSRLSCQIELKDELDGMVVEIPNSQ
ncbi:MAG: 2Fe-2S iron-sulfur cluster binding domain-containing protein [Opitutales bacterium]|nr:2Fe-2S iron-sulfur cluster binding domain-containing protein [Opitutales bacterium]